MTTDNAKREQEFVREWKTKSKQKGDYYWRLANGWSGQGDLKDSDWGEEPRGV